MKRSGFRAAIRGSEVSKQTTLRAPRPDDMSVNAHPGASYLRTDQSCPSLRQADDQGDPIYAVYRPAGWTEREVCAAVRAAGDGAYGKWLNYTADPSRPIRC